MSAIVISKSLSLCEDFDVVVAGGGPAGCAAAVAAAREGAKTLLLEATGALGGMGTGGLVPAWCPFSDKEKLVYRGLAATVFHQAKAASPHISPEDTDWVPIDPEALKRVYDSLAQKYGVTVLFNTSLCGVQTDNIHVTAALTASKEGLKAYRAPVYVDCSGDADLAVWAGAEFAAGDEKSGELMPGSLCFSLANVDMYAYLYDRKNGQKTGGLHPLNKNSSVYDMAKDEKYPLIQDTHLCSNIIGPGMVGFNAGHIWNVDNSKPQTVSEAMMEGRRMAEEFRAALAEYFPAAFGNAFLAATAPLMGIREGRRIVGDARLTIDDYIARRSFEDGISRNCYYIDLHRSRAESQERAAGKPAANNGGMRYGKGESHGIPYRCLIPKGVDNVLVAGRSVSCDRQLQASVRVMPNCLCMGEAAGIAAATAAALHGGRVREVDIVRLRERLTEEGAYL
ncbi:MAG: FAD-dependent oxidoreductase [Oscillospiraceae bacterium]|jgi:hypothetical protein|nr:FAD-dependent oxidoreductase [Oscillospiraceae bacterium]